MSKIFLYIINMSISAGYVVLAVVLLRLLLKKAPRWLTASVWATVGLRLIMPFSIKSALSLIPSAEVVSPDIMTDKTPSINSGIPFINESFNPIIQESFTPNPAESANPLQIWVPILTAVWLLGVALMLLYLLVSYLRVRKQVSCAVLYSGKVYQADFVSSPFILGIFKPKIYIPFNMNEKHRNYVIAHEMAHIKRRDHIWKPLAFLLLSVYWFNPLLWIAYILFSRDIEFACDEKVTRELDREARASYSEALVNSGKRERMVAACPLAFGEVGVKARIKSVLSYKRPAFWIIILSLIASLVLAVCFLTNPKGTTPEGAFTEYEGVYITIDSTEDLHHNKLFRVTLHNETNEKITYGNVYYIDYKENGEWKLSAMRENTAFTLPAYTLAPHSSVEREYSSAFYDVKRGGTYRLRIPFSVKENGEYKNYSAYAVFELEDTSYYTLDASEGLDVCVWQMAKGSYSFGLLPHSDEPHLFNELMDLYAVSASEMREILSTYEIEEDKIYIVPWQNPLSSYIGEYWIILEGEGADVKRAAYIENIRAMLFGEDN